MMALCLNGCIAAAIPALAGAAMVRGSDKAGKAGVAQAAVAAAATAAPAADPTPAATLVEPAAAPAPTPANLPANVIIGPAPEPKRDSATGLIELAPGTPYSALATYAEQQARAASAGGLLQSAILRNPAALDGKRSACTSRLPLVLIDLDPAEGMLAPGPAPAADPAFATALQSLRDRRIEIAWISGSPAAQAPVIRTALTASGLDPKGEDRLVLLRQRGDRKQARRADLAKGNCIIAIAGDARADFDELFDYLVNPEAALGLELLMGEGWFLIPPVLANP
jgi:hypothetical protein